MAKKLVLLQGILLVILGAAIVLLGLAVYTLFRGDDPSDYNNARFVKAPIVREVDFHDHG